MKQTRATMTQMMQMMIRQKLRTQGLVQMIPTQMTPKTVITLAAVQTQTRGQVQMTAVLQEGAARTINQPTPAAK